MKVHRTANAPKSDKAHVNRLRDAGITPCKPVGR